MNQKNLALLGQQVRQARLKGPVSQEGMAEKAGISKDTWRRVEKGLPVRELTYRKIDVALQWEEGACQYWATYGMAKNLKVEKPTLLEVLTKAFGDANRDLDFPISPREMDALLLQTLRNLNELGVH